VQCLPRHDLPQPLETHGRYVAPSEKLWTSDSQHAAGLPRQTPTGSDPQRQGMDLGEVDR
jgi:hypothetical protein